MAERVVLVRHGETDWSSTRRHTGRSDIPLNDEGRRLAASLQPVLAGITGIDTALVLTSPLRRARDTCALAGFGDRAVVEPDLIEWDYGAAEGRRTAEIRVEVPGLDRLDPRPRRRRDRRPGRGAGRPGARRGSTTHPAWCSPSPTPTSCAC